MLNFCFMFNVLFNVLFLFSATTYPLLYSYLPPPRPREPGSDTGSEDMVACRKGYLLDVTFYRALNDLSDTLRSVVSGASVKGFVVSGGTKRSHRCKF